jgi:DNA invertase Pin-like site-specific DNA recombinase
MYLRKSRLDIENEKKTGVADTLANHRKDLLKYAKSHDLDIVDVYEEVVSGDSIIHRPEMIRLLQDVSDKKMDGVLVMDLDRLGRGDLQDQGLILNTFKRSNTLILTPDKVYDLNNEVDEDYAEFKSLVSRKEYKLITKRLKAGVRHFIEDGNYIPPIPPYGYKITRTDRTRSLEIIPEQAEVIKLIFDMFMEGTGINQIARDLNALGYKSYYGDAIERSWVSRVLRNPVYAGYIIWSRKEIRKSLDPNKKRTTRTREKDKHLITQGKHEAIISEELFYAVQDKLSEGHNAPVKKSQEIANPLAGQIKCKICGSSMVRV